MRDAARATATVGQRVCPAPIKKCDAERPKPTAEVIVTSRVMPGFVASTSALTADSVTIGAPSSVLFIDVDRLTPCSGPDRLRPAHAARRGGSVEPSAPTLPQTPALPAMSGMFPS